MKKKKSARNKLPSPTQAKRSWKWDSVKAQKAAGIIELAKKVIEGQATLLVKKRSPRSYVTPIPPLSAEKNRKLIAMLKKEPPVLRLEIAKALGVSLSTISRRRKMLVDSGQIPEVDISERQKQVLRKPERKTHVLSRQQRQKFLKENRARIQKKALYIYKSNRKAFDFANMLPETIVDEMIERLNWRLQTYDPKWMSGPKETKLQGYFGYCLQRVALSLRRNAWRKYKPVSSLETEIKEKKALKSLLKAPAESKDLTVENLEKISRRLKLRLFEKTVLFGIAVGLPAKEIAKELGYSDALISGIKKSIEKKIEKLL